MPGKIHDLTNRKYGRLTVISFSHMNKRKSYWNCVCICGNETTVRSDCLKNGTVQSCKCMNYEHYYSIVHGKSKTKLYKVYHSMKQRCYNPKSTGYEHYGGRGIIVCDEWLDNFIRFYNWAIETGYKEGLSINRINNNGNYEPDNCEWIYQKTQMLNTRRNRKCTYHNKNQTLSQWANEYGVNLNTLYSRINHGWDIDKALNTPTKK